MGSKRKMPTGIVDDLKLLVSQATNFYPGFEQFLGHSARFTLRLESRLLMERPSKSDSQLFFLFGPILPWLDKERSFFTFRTRISKIGWRIGWRIGFLESKQRFARGLDTFIATSYQIQLKLFSVGTFTTLLSVESNLEPCSDLRIMVSNSFGSGFTLRSAFGF